MIRICLEDDGSATITSKGPAVSVAFLEGNAQLLERGRREYLFMVAALCEHLSVSARGIHNHWRSLLFERGVLHSDESQSHLTPPHEDCEIWIRLWPDLTILESGIFDTQHTLKLMRPFAESHPAITITVIDARPPRA